MTTTPWILLRGLARDSRHWEDFPQRLQQHYAESTVHCPDLPGNGALADEPSPTRMSEAVVHLRAALLVAGIAPPYRLLAFSLGGMLAMEWMRLHPEEIDGAALVNSSLRGLNPFHERLIPANYPALLGLTLCPGTRRQRERFVLATTTNRLTRDRRNALAERWTGYAASRHTRPLNALRQLWAASRFSAPDSLDTRRVLVLAGDGDRLVNPRCSRRIAAHYRWPLLTHPDAGHDLALDAPDWLLAQLTRHWPT